MNNTLRSFIRESLRSVDDKKILLEAPPGTAAIPRGIAGIKGEDPAADFSIKTVEDVSGKQWDAIKGADDALNTKLQAIIANIDAGVSGLGDPGIIESDDDYKIFVDNVLKSLKFDKAADYGYPFATTLYIAAWLGETELITSRLGEAWETFSAVMTQTALLGAPVDLLTPDVKARPQQESYKRRPYKVSAHQHRPTNNNYGLLQESVGGFFGGIANGGASLTRLAIQGATSAGLELIKLAGPRALRTSAAFQLALKNSPALTSSYDIVKNKILALGQGNPALGATADEIIRTVTHHVLTSPANTTARSAFRTESALQAAVNKAKTNLSSAEIQYLVDPVYYRYKAFADDIDAFAGEWARLYAGTTKTGRVLKKTAKGSGYWFGSWAAIAALLGVADGLVSDKEDVYLTPEQTAAIATAQEIRLRGRPLVEKLRQHLGKISVSSELIASEKELRTALDELSTLLSPDVLNFINSEEFDTTITSWTTLQAAIKN